MVTHDAKVSNMLRATLSRRKQIALAVARKFRGVDPRELEGQTVAAAWQALQTFDPRRGSLVDHVGMRCYREAVRHALWLVSGRREGTRSNKLARFERAPIEEARGVHAPAELDPPRVLEPALARLTAKQREVVLGVYVAGMSDADVAIRVGVSRSAVSDIHRRALRDLREWLGGART